MSYVPSMSSPALDAGRLELLVAELGDVDVVVEILGMLLDDLDGRISRGRAATGLGDHVTSRREAHSLSSAAQQLGATELAARAAAVEHHGGDWAEVETAAHEAVAAWRAWLATTSAPPQVVTNGPNVAGGLTVA